MNNIIYIKGDLLEQNLDIIGHQVNGLGIMGKGIALQIKERYPHVFEKYRKMCNQYTLIDILGKCQIVSKFVGSDKYVANIFGQQRIGTGRQTNYESLGKGLTELKEYAKENNLSVGLPYMIGCGLAGGNWGIVEKIIIDVFNDYQVTICMLDK